MPELTYEDYLSDINMDDLARIVFTLMTEVWVLRDRNAILEHILTDRGCLSDGQVDNYAPDQELASKLEKLRDSMASTILSAPLHKGRPQAIRDILDLANPSGSNRDEP